MTHVAVGILASRRLGDRDRRRLSGRALRRERNSLNERRSRDARAGRRRWVVRGSIPGKWASRACGGLGKSGRSLAADLLRFELIEFWPLVNGLLVFAS
jgi:hypothetical protein